MEKEKRDNINEMTNLSLEDKNGKEKRMILEK